MPAQLALALVTAPVLNGMIKAFKARWQNRRGPGIVQPWFDLVKYLSRESVVSEHAAIFLLAAQGLLLTGAAAVLALASGTGHSFAARRCIPSATSGVRMPARER